MSGEGRLVPTLERVLYVTQGGDIQYCSDCGHWLTAALHNPSNPETLADYICPRCVLDRMRKAEARVKELEDGA